MLKKTNKTNLSTYTRINKDILDKVKIFAKENNYSILSVINDAANEYLNNINKQIK